MGTFQTLKEIGYCHRQYEKNDTSIVIHIISQRLSYADLSHENVTSALHHTSLSSWGFN